MPVDETLKAMLQLCADVQDGFWEAAAHAQHPELAAVFEANAVQWNGFADALFPILLQLDHTSPEARWKASSDRTWMHPGKRLDELDDLAICEECMRGLEQARSALERATSSGYPQVRQALQDQVHHIDEQQADIVHAVEQVP